VREITEVNPNADRAGEGRKTNPPPSKIPDAMDSLIKEEEYKRAHETDMNQSNLVAQWWRARLDINDQTDPQISMAL